MALHFHCSNKGCDWSGTYKDLQENHVCPFTTMETQVENVVNHPQEGKSILQYLGDVLHYVWLVVYGFVLPIVEVGQTVHELTWKTVYFLKTLVGLQLERSMVRRLETEVRQRDGMILKLQERLNLMDTSLAEMTIRLSNVTHPMSTNGILLWKIDDFTHKREDAVSGVETAIYSPAFYTSQFGYKMCARAFLNGNGPGKGTHISLFVIVMKGAQDALQPWPLQKQITMMLLDQNMVYHVIDKFRSDPESSSFQKPKTNMNTPSGSPLFMPLDGLNNRAYVKDDTMFIKIIVD